ncbi:MAG: type I-MYXAN CRISPR-associated protein Cas6/Cmx6 [Betaproteobacteria bacterium]|nr:type I-MYXAN CRISPR-associated protein Cas6/Cmx6 [Betaproteobacteria bacterium]
MTDLVFDLKGTLVPEDHAHALLCALERELPWLGSEAQVGVHPIGGAATGTGELILNRRAKLTLRLPLHRVADAKTLSGHELALGPHRVSVGPAKEKPLTLHTPLYAHCVVTGNRDEAQFARDIMKALDERGIDTRFICGRARSLSTPDGTAWGFSLLLHGLPVEHAIAVQERGIGQHHLLGCGLFIPHKSIAALE